MPWVLYLRAAHGALHLPLPLPRCEGTISSMTCVRIPTATVRLSSGLDVGAWPLDIARNIIEVVYSFGHRETEVTRTFVIRLRVAASCPFLLRNLQPIFNR